MASGVAYAINTEALRRARYRKGWTVRDVAARCTELGTKVDFSSYARYEQGATRPNPEKLKAVADALGLDVDDLVLSKNAA